MPAKLSMLGIPDFWRRFRKNRPAVGAVFVFFVFVILAIFAPWIALYPPLQTGDAANFMAPSINTPMGTDNLGRDVYSNFLWGARASLAVGAGAALFAAFIGILVGTVAGYFGGKVDEFLMRVTEFFLTLPLIVLALVMLAIWSRSILNIVLIIAVLAWPTTARLLRAEFLKVKQLPYVEASRALGSGHLRIMFSDMLPNAIFPVVVNASIEVARAMLAEAGLSFLGLGDPKVVTWGTILYWGRLYLTNAPWITVFPGLSIFLVILSLNLIGDGLNDALNPRLREA